MENESDMVIFSVLLMPLFLWGCSKLFLRLGCKVINFEGVETPYSIGFCTYIAVIYSIYLFELDVGSTALFYLTVLWLTGFIDDYFGTKYPKGLKGHIHLFLTTGTVSTGVLKLSTTVIGASVFAVFNNSSGLIPFTTMFFLLIITPHVMNLFDTRPLRVWKVVGLHSLMFISVFLQISIQFRLVLIFLIAALVYFEAKRISMLGDNGATLLGGVVSLLVIYNLSLLMQWVILFMYFFIIVVTERISLSEWIEKRPIIKWIDRWGVS